MNKKTLYAILLAALLIAGIVLLIKIVGGAVTLVSGALNTVLGVALILALALIVAWMFRYAKRR